MNFENELLLIKKGYLDSVKTQNQIISDFNVLYQKLNEELDLLTKGKNSKIYPRTINDAEILTLEIKNFNNTLYALITNKEYLKAIFNEAFYKGNYSFILTTGAIIINSDVPKSIKDDIRGIYLSVLELTNIGDIEKDLKELTRLKIIVSNYLLAAKEGIENWFEIAKENERALRKIYKVEDPFK
ncbi:MAG TPA: hypothetical protein VJ954_09555 [Ignavibacteriaceae bacterium]|nr:hypothetical protein [Ignavibacteriaceae bacterium]